ncbi:MAG: DUF1028 domain-containing protein [Planctomycetaceae bacterium]
MESAHAFPASVDPENHVCGAAVASKYPAVGKVVPYVGAFCTQHYHVPKWGEPALDLLQNGKRPEAVLFELLKEDKDSELRQLAVIDLAKKYAELKHEAKGNWFGGKLPFQHPCPDRPKLGKTR